MSCKVESYAGGKREGEGGVAVNYSCLSHGLRPIDDLMIAGVPPSQESTQVLGRCVDAIGSVTSRLSAQPVVIGKSMMRCPVDYLGGRCLPLLAACFLLSLFLLHLKPRTTHNTASS